MAIVKPPRIIFDTNIFIDAAKGDISHADWQTVREFVNRNFVHAITPVTVAELLEGIARGDERHFEANQRPLQKLAQSFSSVVHVPHVKYFLHREIFDLDTLEPLGVETDFATVVDIVLCANTKEDLSTLNVKHKGFKAGVRLSALLEQNDERRGRLEKQLDAAKSWPADLPKDEWAYLKMVDLEIPQNPANRKIFKERLDGCYRVERILLGWARSENWKGGGITAHVGDMNQTAYLAADDMHFVTREKQIVRAIEGSSQSRRAHRWNDFIALARNTER
jgi:predicted nucleic acid-binding protein